MSKPLPEVYFDLARVRERLAEPTSWCKLYYQKGYQMCLDQAVGDVAKERAGPWWSEPYARAAWLLLEAANEDPNVNYNSLVQFNDHHSTTHADVLAVTDRAMDLAVERAHA